MLGVAVDPGALCFAGLTGAKGVKERGLQGGGRGSATSRPGLRFSSERPQKFMPLESASGWGEQAGCHCSQQEGDLSVLSWEVVGHWLE